MLSSLNPKRFLFDTIITYHYYFLVGGQSNNLPPQVNGISHQEYLESYLHFYQPVNQITLIQN